MDFKIEGPFLHRSSVCVPLLRMLPEWFALEADILEYEGQIEQLPTFLAREEETVLGFLSLIQHNEFSAEILVMAVHPQSHQRGIGRALVASAEAHARSLGVEYMQVKTLGPPRPDEHYARTRLFYAALGYRPLEEFTRIWDEDNPCLVLVKQFESLPMNRRPAAPLIIIRQRRRKRERTHRAPAQRLRRLGLGLGSLLGIVGALLVIAAALAYSSVTRDLPPVEWLEVLLDPSAGLLRQPTRLVDRSGQHDLATLAPADGERLFLPYEEFPSPLVLATLALSQPDFWESPGYAITGLDDPGSHPTLAQALVSTFLLADEPPSRVRALRERLLAAQVTARYGREEILAWVLNSTDYGHYAYGVEAAAQLYLGKSAADLSLSEACLLAAVGQAPALNPLDAPQAAEAGRMDTLARLLRLGWVTEAATLEAVNDVPVILAAPARDEGIISGQFVDLVLRQLDTALGAGQVERGGAVIFTGIEYALQEQADCALRFQIARLLGDPDPAEDDSTCSSATLLSTVKQAASGAQVSAGALILDPATGQVLAAAGDLSAQPAGTTITPFLYLAGFARGLSPASLGWDIPADEPVLGQVYQGPVRLRIALANDYLPPARTVLEQMGVENVLPTAASFGLELPSTGLLQEDFDLSPFDLAFAYSVLAAEGQQTGQRITPLAGTTSEARGLELAAVLQVVHADGSLWLDWTSSHSQSVVTPGLSYLLTDVLSDESARLSSLGDANTLSIGVPAAVKAARTLDESGAWTVGYTPRRTVVVFVSGAGSVSRSASDGLWSALARTAVRDLPFTGWEIPAGVVSVKVCDPSGLLPTRACPNVVEEVFLEGRQPVQYDMLYQEFEINIETGLLATVFTPPDMVERRIYMVPPPAARGWAEAVGIEMPPADYDNYQTPPALPHTHITTPVMFSDGRGTLEIRGTAAGDDFVSYRLEYGMGLNPERWYLLGEDVTSPVTEDLLGTWDTSSLDGLYTLRLMVVRLEDRVDEALLQMTLDNTPPEILLLHPQNGQEISLAEEAYIIVQTEVEEDYLEQVVFYLDGVEVGTATSAPYWTVWEAKVGGHALRVTATDRVGNVSEAEIRFTVKK